MPKKKKINFYLAIGSIVLLLGFLSWFLSLIFEGEKPGIELSPLPDYISSEGKFTLTALDMKRGLKALRVSVRQEGREITLLEKRFPFKGLLNSEGAHRFDTEFSIDPLKLGLAQGRMDLEVRIWDYSRRSGGDGNLALVQHKMVVDTIPPAIRAVSRMHFINVGGSGLVVYQASSDSVESGLFVNKVFFKGFPVNRGPREGLHVCYFAIPYDTKPNPDIYLWAKDRAGNCSRGGFYCHVRRKRFRTDRINISDGLLKRVLAYFPDYPFDPGSDEINRFLEINRVLRQKNTSVFYDLMGQELSPARLWEGTWLRLKNAATMAKFADHRLYYYKGKLVDEQVHLGVDLASLANSEVQAANSGRVIFAGNLGIYGLTVVLDHGQSLASIYSHMSRMDVVPGDEVDKGKTLGLTGRTGLAGGDHLHFGVMVGSVFVNPLEWWDNHWIRDNITRKLALLDK